MSNVKNRSRAARKQAGLSVGQAARWLGMSADAVTKIEEDDAAYAVADHAKMADVYGVDVEWLAGGGASRDYDTIDRMRGADTLSFHDRDVLAEFAASMPRRTK